MRVLHRVTRGTATRRLPCPRDVDPWFIGDDWVNCAVVRVAQPYSQSEFMLVGSNLCQPGSVLEGEPISKCPATSLLGLTLFYFEQAVEERSFLVIEGAALDRGGPILYRSLLVPLSEDDKKVDAVLIAANSRACRQGEYTGPATRLVWSHGFGAHRGDRA